MLAKQSNKAKIAKRVIEVLDYFDHAHQTATVMDIVRRYDRPQSSTSELLSSLVEFGLLYKDLETRSYTLTPRAAILGSITQPNFVRDGRLNGLVERLAQRTHLSVGIFGMVGLETQIFCWHNGEPPLKAANPKGIYGGMQERLTDSAVGWLLLSTLEKNRREGTVRRLNAEASDDKQFNYREMLDKIEGVRDCGFASGHMGYGSIADICAVLIPGNDPGHPLALGLVCEPGEDTCPEDFVVLLRDAVQTCEDSPVEMAVEGTWPMASAA